MFHSSHDSFGTTRKSSVHGHHSVVMAADKAFTSQNGEHLAYHCVMPGSSVVNDGMEVMDQQ